MPAFEPFKTQGNIYPTVEIPSTDGSFNPNGIATVIISMTSNIVNLSLDGEATKDGIPLIIAFDQDSTGGRTCSFDANDFQGGLDQGLPILDGTLSTRDLTGWVWNDNVKKFSCVSHVRQYANT